MKIIRLKPECKNKKHKNDVFYWAFLIELIKHNIFVCWIMQ